MTRVISEFQLNKTLCEVHLAPYNFSFQVLRLKGPVVVIAVVFI